MQMADWSGQTRAWRWGLMEDEPPPRNLPIAEGEDRLECRLCGAHNSTDALACSNCGESLAHATYVKFKPRPPRPADDPGG